jgi:hydroxymethylbilane synthase
LAGRVYRIATRGSLLALEQSNRVKAMLEAVDPEIRVELVRIVSTGDAQTGKPLHELGGVGLFTREVQEALLDGRADLAVHSLKDLPTEAHPELVLAAVPERAPVEDALLSPRWKTLDALPEGAKVATSSLRRRAQLLALRPDLDVVDIRGNVDTRIRKLHEQGLDGLLLARAGLVRLGRDGEITETIGIERMIPAVGQGALGIECRKDDADTAARLAPLEHADTRLAVSAERTFLRLVEGGCQVPIGGHARFLDERRLEFRAVVLSRDGQQALRFHRDFDFPSRDLSPESLGQADDAGRWSAESMLKDGAAELRSART